MKHHDVIEQLSATIADPAFGQRILPGTAKGRAAKLGAHRRVCPSKHGSSSSEEPDPADRYEQVAGAALLRRGATPPPPMASPGILSSLALHARLIEAHCQPGPLDQSASDSCKEHHG